MLRDVPEFGKYTLHNANARNQGIVPYHTLFQHAMYLLPLSPFTFLPRILITSYSSSSDAGLEVAREKVVTPMVDRWSLLLHRGLQGYPAQLGRDIVRSGEWRSDMFKAGRDENYDVCGLIDLLRAIRIVYPSSQHFIDDQYTNEVIKN